MARLVFLHPEKVAGTSFQYFGQCSAEGLPVTVTPHPQFEHQLQHMEYLLHHSQTYMDRAQMRSEMQEMEIQSLRGELEASQKELGHEGRMRRIMRKRIASLKDTVATLTAQTKEMKSRIEELEVEGNDLCKENEAFLSDDDDYMEEMDMEPDVDTDDDDFINNKEDPKIVISEEEEDLEEPPFIKEDAPQAPVYHVVDIADE
jgi:chromosome segregation ATPase